MKKIFKKLKLRDIVFTILGLLIGGSVGITATTYVLQSSEIQYKDNKSVQQAIEELYVLAENGGGSNETLPIGDVTVSGYTIIVPYTGSYPIISCVYGTDENYGRTGTISNNTCTFRGTNSNQMLYYKIVSTDNTGKIYENNGSTITSTCNVDDNDNCIATTTYTTGDAIKLGGYNWHVIGDDGVNLTLLMDANQLGDNSIMHHCTKDTDALTDCVVDSTGQYYVYSWGKSLIREYLNKSLLSELESKINNDIVQIPICADPSRNDGITYGGYLMSELSALGKTNSCSTKVTDKVRLISYSEYYNMSPNYTDADSSYPNVENIKRISSSEDYASWLYSSSIDEWWTMAASYNSATGHVEGAKSVYTNGYFSIPASGADRRVRPVITIVK